MTYLSRLKNWFGILPEGNGPRVAVIGDSHTAALSRAREFKHRAELYQHIKIVRVRKEKEGRTIGDLDLQAFLKRIRRFGPEDFVFSAAGGNQYAIVSTVQNVIDFDFLGSAIDDEVASDRAQLVPQRTIAGYIESGVRGNDGPMLEAIRRSTTASVFHIAPPPPKRDNAFLARYMEGRFAAEGMGELGPTRPQLRLKTWRVQENCLRQLCQDLDIGFVPPPQAALTQDGFLAERFYGKDATHANRRYGELVLKQILDITRTADAPSEAVA